LDLKQQPPNFLLTTFAFLSILKEQEKRQVGDKKLGVFLKRSGIANKTFQDSPPRIIKSGSSPGCR